MKHLLKKPATLGDTIVEVMLALALVSSMLGGAYVVANRSLNNTRQAKERGEALKLLESQAERLESAERVIQPQLVAQAEIFCMNVMDTNSTVLEDSYILSNVTALPSLADDAFGQYRSECKAQIGGVTYHLTGEPISTPDGHVFTFRARWERAGGGGRDEAQLTYRLPIPGIAFAPSPPPPGPPGPPPPVPPPPPGPVCLSSTISVNPSGGGYDPNKHLFPAVWGGPDQYTLALSGIGACAYNVVVNTWDPAHPSTELQPDERVFLEFYRGGNLICTSTLSDDLPDNTVGPMSSPVGSCDFTAGAPTHVTVKHFSLYPGSGTIPTNSIDVDSIDLLNVTFM